MRLFKVGTLALTLLALFAPGALADDETRDDAMPRPPYTSEVAGIRIIPSILAHDVVLHPTKTLSHSVNGWPNAEARVYTAPDGAIVGLTLKAWGLGSAPGFGQSDAHFVVWLADKDTGKVLNIGELDALNRGEAVLGYTPKPAVRGFNTLMITREHTAAVVEPMGWRQLEAELPRATTWLPPIIPVAPPPRR